MVHVLFVLFLVGCGSVALYGALFPGHLGMVKIEIMGMAFGGLAWGQYTFRP